MDPEPGASVGTMISYIVSNTWVKIKILTLNWEVWNTNQKSTCQKIMKETKILAGFQLLLFWVVYAVPMIVGQFVGMRNNIVARMKKTHYGKVAHSARYCISML